MKITFERYKKEFVDKAKINGYSMDNINKCLSYAKPIISAELPVIYNTSHLGSLVGYNKTYLKRAVNSPKYFYRDFKVKKSNGGFRTISEPLPSLKEIQSWILNEILYKIRISRYAKGYVRKRGIKDHVKYHTKEKLVFTLDIEKFFDSIKFVFVEGLFLKMGYSKLVSNLIAKLCYLEDGLPQGAPTSPYLTNILLYEFDENISRYCRENNIKYTRYADDLAFSGNKIKGDLVKLIEAELNKLQLRLNVEKSNLMQRSEPQIISGIIVNDKTQVSKLKRNQIRNSLFYIKKFGFESHVKRTQQTKDNYLIHLIGKINYILMINPEDKEFIEYKKLLYSILDSQESEKLN